MIEEYYNSISKCELQNILRRWKTDSTIPSSVPIAYGLRDGYLKLYTAYPGYLIGEDGWLINKYKILLVAIGVTGLDIVEIDSNMI